YLAAAHRFEQILKLYPDKSVAPDALYFLALSYHDLGADDWASEHLTLLAEKYPNSQYSSKGKSLLAKIGGEQPSTLLALKAEPVPSSSSPAAPPPRTQPSVNQVLKNQPTGNQSGRAVGLIPSVPSRSFSLPSATALSQSFVSCRLGVWC
ncbi:MAG TPA: hypothetical protein VE222_09805, partial [Nitrospiraceae bacterium]|nr:hypothetical protein [Nitrospiraceae bacterium]